jgi:hypothetical protein
VHKYDSSNIKFKIWYRRPKEALTLLNLRVMQMNPEIAIIITIINALNKNNTLIRLDLRCRGIGSECDTLIESALVNNFTLTEIILCKKIYRVIRQK